VVRFITCDRRLGGGERLTFPKMPFILILPRKGGYPAGQPRLALSGPIADRKTNNALH
jgi:hypothetical protein